MKTNKLKLARIFLCFALLLSVFGFAFTTVNQNVVAKAEEVEINDTIEVTDAVAAGWGHGSDELIFIIRVTPHSSVTGVWNFGYTNYQTANGGVDIFEYIYIGAESARTAVRNNESGVTSHVGESGWLGNGGVCAPVFMETNSEGIVVKIDTDYSTTSFNFTIKAGFQLLNSNGVFATVTEDVVFGYDNGTLSKDEKTYTLTFDGTDVAKKLSNGAVIGELPEVPAREGFVGVWQIDGVEINASTVYNYGENKTAVAVYTEIPVVQTVDITDRLQMEDRAWFYNEESGFHNNAEVYVALLDTGITHADGTQYLNTTVNDTWYYGNTNVITANNGGDIMQYILVNDVTARALIDANATGANKSNAGCGCWLSNSAAYPVYVETTANSGLMIRLAKDEFGAAFTVTIKAGFEITNTNGDRVAITKDIDFVYNNGVITKEFTPEKYTLTFECEGLSFDAITVKAGRTIAKLPNLPEREGYVAFWSIDGEAVTNETIYNYGESKVAVANYLQNEFTVSFDGADAPVDAITVIVGQAMANLPAVPERANYEAVWTIDGEVVTAETVFDYTSDKTAVAVYTEVVDITDRIFMEDRAWGAAKDEVYVALLDTGINNATEESPNYWFNTHDSVNSSWNVDWDANYAERVIANNRGVNVLDYILINGESAKSLIDKNVAGTLNGKQYVGTNGWLVHAQCCPVFVETTNGDGFIIKLTKEFTGTEFVLTIKAGFRIINAQGQIVKVTEDVEFTYANGVISRDYVLSFEGVEGVEAKTVAFGKAIGELPEIPAQDGYVCYWAIDGEEITSASGYNYLGSKTAVATYVRDTFVLSFEGTDAFIDAIEVKTNKAMENLPAIPERAGYFGYWTINGDRVSNQTVFNYGADVTAVAVYVESTDIADRLFMEDRAWGAHDGELYVALLDMGRIDGQGNYWLNTAQGISGTWYVGNNDIITANGGYDIMQYILINGVSARELITANANGEANTNACDCWLSNPAAYPVYVETTDHSGLMIKTAKAFIGEDWVITIKAGFTILDVDGNRVHVSKDVEFSLNEEGAIVRDYLLTFEGVDNAREIAFGELIGELPEVPQKDGYVGVWSIDGAEITAESHYNYFGDRKVVVTYTAIDYTITINRADGEVETLTFNDLTKTDVLASIALTEDDLFFAYSWQEALPEVLEFRDYTLVEVATEVPANTRIISYSVSIGVNFTMNVYVEVVGDVPSMKFVMGGREVVANGVLVDVTIGKYVYKLTDIKASELAEEFTATLFIGERVIDSVDYSVEAYLNKLALREDLSEELKTLIADVIVYGQKAEEIAGKESGIQEIDGLVASEFEELTESDEKTSSSKHEDVAITNVHVEHGETAKIAVVFRAVDATNVTVTVNGEEVEFALVEDAVGIYKVVTGDLFVTNTDVDYVVRILVDGTEIQWVVYDYNSYIYEVQDDEDNEFIDLVKAIYNVSKSAKAYSEGE